jgi:NodT family efflux transporter outer membrane factor (OMF) lipoprotein
MVHPMPALKNSAAHNAVRQTGAWLAAAAACWCLTGCSVGPDFHPIATRVPDGYIAASSPEMPRPPENKNNQPVIDAAKWWQALNDPELNALIDRAIKGNYDIEIALERMQEARMQEVVVLGGALPQAGISYGAAGGTGSNLATGRVSGPLIAGENTGQLNPITQVVGFDAVWELDVFGKYRREIEAARYNTEAAIAARNAVLISVIADVARAYVDMRAFQMRLAVLQDNTAILQDNLTLTRERFDHGITNELDLTLAQRELASLQSEQAPLVSQIHAAQYVIAVLLGKFPEDLAEELEKPGVVPQLPEKVEAGLPLDLLRRRPDIREAERVVASATAGIGVATGDLFPHVSVTGAYGQQYKSLGATPSNYIWSAGPSASWSLLDFGALDALVEIANLRTKEALVYYKQTVLAAVREVDTSLEAYSAEQNRLRNLGQALAASQRAVSLATERYDRGLTDYLNVIDAERQEYALEDQYVVSQQTAGEQFIFLYKALGGGWEQYQSLPPIYRPKPAVQAAFARLSSAEDPLKAQDPSKN